MHKLMYGCVRVCFNLLGVGKFMPTTFEEAVEGRDERDARLERSVQNGVRSFRLTHLLYE